MNDEMPEMLTLGEAVAYVGISRATLWRMIQRGELHTKVNALDRRQRLVPKEKLDRLLAEGRRKTREE